MTEPRELPDDDWTPRGDRMLAMLPREHPFGFNRLPFEEQQWRGRIFLMVYTHTGSVTYSWWSAMRSDQPEGAKEYALSIDEEQMAFLVNEAAQGRWYGPPEQPTMAGAPGSPGPA